ncbi:hypothetical protein [Campylobacter showae]|uniref:hypothetical protein n=1 Tax=Campylobacter showae TaxID=204 RepID=UPI000F087178|nr:hypothetical protein [Campylobacter showae]
MCKFDFGARLLHLECTSEPFRMVLLRCGRSILPSCAQNAGNKAKKPPKFASFKFRAKFTDGANPEPSNLQSRTDYKESRLRQIL